MYLLKPVLLFYLEYIEATAYCGQMPPKGTVDQLRTSRMPGKCSATEVHATHAISTVKMRHRAQKS